MDCKWPRISFSLEKYGYRFVPTVVSDKVGELIHNPILKKKEGGVVVLFVRPFLNQI